MKFKFNWGTGIIVSSILFMTFTVITGLTLMNQKIDLVNDNYYEQELKYQDMLKQSEGTWDKLTMEYRDNHIELIFAEENKNNTIAGEIKFYRPSDSSKDFKVALTPGKEGKQRIYTTGIDKGYWKLQVTWSAGKQQYYYEKPLLIN